MNVQLNEALILRTRRRVRDDQLTFGERMAMHWFWRRKVKVPIIAKVFKVGKNTVYYKSLTGEADSYPTSSRSNSVAEVRALFDKMGEAEVRRVYVRDQWVEEVNALLLAEVALTERRGPRRPRR
jgi:hypothetical protein